MNVKLKFKIYEEYGSQCNAARDFSMREDRLSQIIHQRRTPTDQEKRQIAEKLRTDIEELFSD